MISPATAVYRRYYFRFARFPFRQGRCHYR